MVARITMPRSIQETLNYNEHKVRKGVASCLGENNFLLPAHVMNFHDKLNEFQTRNSLNQRATSNTIHVSLNFDISENLPDTKLLDIANDYMSRIGFADQPYLIYKHKDAGHPHIHIVSTTIKTDGSRINTHNIGRNQSEAARKLIEDKYHLVRASREQTTNRQSIRPFDLTRLEYGKAETKRGIANIVSQVVNLYNYTSLPEYNAMLQQFGIVADRGCEGGFIHQKNGLLYRVLDNNGNKMGVPIKASSLPGKPTIAYLERRFAANQSNREAGKQSLKQTLDDIIMLHPKNIRELMGALKQRKVLTVLRQNEECRIYGVTFVDNKNKVVFNGSALGKAYSIAALQQQLTQHAQNVQRPSSYINEQHNESSQLQILDGLIRPIEDHSMAPIQLRKRRRKSKNK